MRPLLGSRATAVRTRSMSAALRTPAAVTVIPNEAEAALTTCRNATFAVISGTWTTAARRTRGAICLSSSNHFPPSAGSKLWNPGNVSTRMRQACDKAASDRIGHPCEDDRDDVGRLHQSRHSRIGGDQDHVRRERDQFSGGDADAFGVF